MICDFKDTRKITLNRFSVTVSDKCYENALELKCLDTGTANSSAVNGKSKEERIQEMLLLLLLLLLLCFNKQEIICITYYYTSTENVSTLPCDIHSTAI
jgi:hypothetical protein